MLQMVTKCIHSLHKIYFRYKTKWVTIENLYYCNKCKKIIKLK